jgi:putative multiple sugar transport system substrate-binding protein
LNNTDKPVTIEFLMDAPEDHNALLFYQGVMEQLQPYLHTGVLKCLSGRTAFEDACIPEETVSAASDRCFGYLTEFYTAAAPDVLCCASDTLAAGCIDALESFGLELGEQWPLITGCGATQEGLENISSGHQSISFHTDLDAQVKDCVQWVLAAIEGEELIADEVSNGTVQVPCKLQTPVQVAGQNYKAYMEQE